MERGLIGREDLLSVLPAALESARWISLVGPPGSGKTAVLRALVRDRADVTWVNARGVARVPDLVRACLDELHELVAPSDTPIGALTRALDGRSRWLVVDGVDIDDFDSVVTEVMATTSEARVLTTSSSLHPHPGRRIRPRESHSGVPLWSSSAGGSWRPAVIRSTSRRPTRRYVASWWPVAGCRC